jgi:hypothetical protein
MSSTTTPAPATPRIPVIQLFVVCEDRLDSEMFTIHTVDVSDEDWKHLRNLNNTDADAEGDSDSEEVDGFDHRDKHERAVYWISFLLSPKPALVTEEETLCIKFPHERVGMWCERNQCKEFWMRGKLSEMLKHCEVVDQFYVPT